MPDILLNVFLAIAVDNLADADSLTAIEKEEEAKAKAAAASGKTTVREIRQNLIIKRYIYANKCTLCLSVC